MSDTGEVMITIEDQCDLSRVPLDFAVRSKIKDAGGPVAGCTMLKFLPEYDIMAEFDVGSNSLIVKWRRSEG